MSDHEPTSDLELTLAVWRECEGALGALQSAFRRTRELYPGLSALDRADANNKLAGLARRTGLLVLTVGFPGYVTKE